MSRVRVSSAPLVLINKIEDFGELVDVIVTIMTHQPPENGSFLFPSRFGARRASYLKPHETNLYATFVSALIYFMAIVAIIFFLRPKSEN